MGNILSYIFTYPIEQRIVTNTITEETTYEVRDQDADVAVRVMGHGKSTLRTPLLAEHDREERIHRRLKNLLERIECAVFDLSCNLEQAATQKPAKRQALAQACLLRRRIIDSAADPSAVSYDDTADILRAVRKLERLC